MSDPKRYELYVDASLQAEEGGEWVKWDDYARLKAEVDRLTKAGDFMYADVKARSVNGISIDELHSMRAWEAAKKGGQP